MYSCHVIQKVLLKMLRRCVTRFNLPITLRSSRKSILPLLEGIDANTTTLSHLCLNSSSGGDRRPEAVAFIEAETGNTITFAQTHRNTLAFASLLQWDCEVLPGKVVCIFAPNSIHYAAIWHGVVSLGAVASTVSMAASAQELARQVQIARAMLVVTLPELEGVAKEALKSCPGVQLHVFTLETLPTSTCQIRSTRLDAVCALPFSSGTTGLPKGVQLTQRNLIANILQMRESESIVFGDVVLAVLPYFHIYGLTVGMNLGLYVGATQVVFKKFDLALYVKCIEKYTATHLYIAPPLAIALAKSPVVLQHKCDSVKKIMSAAAPLGSALQGEVMTRFPNAQVRQGYGLTETSPVTHFQPDNCSLTGTIGTLIPDTEARVVSTTTGADLGPHEEGEIWVRGPQLMKGYQKDEDTKGVMAEGGWFKTGDIGKYDERGYFFITDRLKELIKVKGFQVPPAELEHALLSHPDILDAVVFGLPHESHGETPVAHVQLKAGVERTAEKATDIQQFVAKKVAPYKQIGSVRFVDVVPKSASGKLLRRVSKDLELKERQKAD